MWHPTVRVHVNMTSEDTAQEPPDTERPLLVFRNACSKFRDLARSTEAKRNLPYGGSLYGSAKEQLTYIFRHPFRAYADLWKIAVSYPSSLNALDYRFPVEEMLLYLKQYSVAELRSLKALTALNLRTHKDRLTDNPVFKASIPIGALYALLKVGSEWAPKSKLATEVAEHLNVVLNTEIVSALFFGMIIGLTVAAVQILFLIAPGIARAQLLDDLVLIALES